MHIILLETLNKLGKAGEIVTVKDGYANNYLLPQKKAIIANKKNREDLDSKMDSIKHNNEKKLDEANEIKSKLEGKKIVLEMECNDDGNLYGKVSQKSIIDKIKDDFSIDLSVDNIILPQIKSLGDYDVSIRLYDNIMTKLIIEIIKKS